MRIFTLSILALGLAIALYMVYVGFNANALVCPATKLINCEAVITSVFAKVFGVPLSVYASAWFAVAIILEYMRSRAAKLWALVGVAGVAYSVAAMAILGEICIYCSTLDAIILVYLAIVFGAFNAKA